ncbi:hypothetical protein [Klebsiella quasipneumoniae]|uniref:hypothetical protein n=1 Tax=Klebsiella quasipneumoniae TaxID=1463165 RepID=UPI00389048D7
MTGWQRFSQTSCRSVVGVMAAAKPAKLSAGRRGRRDFDWRASIATCRAGWARFPLSPALRVPSRCWSGEGMQLTDGIGVNHVLNTVENPSSLAGILHSTHIFWGETMILT